MMGGFEDVRESGAMVDIVREYFWFDRAPMKFSQLRLQGR